MTALEVWGSLIADSLSIRDELQARSIKPAAAAAGVPSASARAAEVAEVMAQVQAGVAASQRRQAAERRATEAREEAAEAQRARMRRQPRWMQAQAETAAERPWTDSERAELSALLKGGDEAACNCAAFKRRRTGAQPHSYVTDAATCCFARLTHAGEVLHRSLPDVDRQLQQWSMVALDRTWPLATATPLPAVDFSGGPLSESSIAAAWSAAGECEFLPASLHESMGVASLPRWTHAAVHQLMGLVRQAREELSSERERLRTTAAAQEDVTELAQTGSQEDELADLPPETWVRIAAALALPQPPSAARAVYFSVLSCGGFMVPPALATQPPFFFPPQPRYEAEAKFEFEGAEEQQQQQQQQAQTESEEGEDEEEDDDRSSAFSLPHAQPDPEQVLREVRRLSKRYRRG